MIKSEDKRNRGQDKCALNFLFLQRRYVLMGVWVMFIILGTTLYSSYQSRQFDRVQRQMQAMNVQMREFDSVLRRVRRSEDAAVLTRNRRSGSVGQVLPQEVVVQTTGEQSKRLRRCVVMLTILLLVFQGVTYVRWGRKDCTNHGRTKLIYHGAAAGSLSTHTGGTSNLMCIHHNVSYSPGHFFDGNQGASYLYGLEYRDSAWVKPLFDLTLTESLNIQYHSVPCAICLAETKLTQLMIPGQEDCPDGWNMEYRGYIMATGHSDKHSTSHICVDETPQVIPGTQGSQGGAYLFMMETQCTSLLCEPFVIGREVRCVVCTL